MFSLFGLRCGYFGGGSLDLESHKKREIRNERFCFSKEVVSDLNLTNKLLFKFACSSSEEVPL